MVVCQAVAQVAFLWALLRVWDRVSFWQKIGSYLIWSHLIAVAEETLIWIDVVPGVRLLLHSLPTWATWCLETRLCLTILIKKITCSLFSFFRDGDLLLYLVTPRRRIWPMGHRPIFSQTSVHFLRLFSNKKLNLFVKILPSNCKLEHKLRSNLKLLCFKFQVTQKQSIVSERIRVSRHLQMLSLSS